MSYYIGKEVNLAFEDAIEKVTEQLAEEGFGILSEIDVGKTLKKKLNVDFRKYKILGACNPHYAYQALQTEGKIGTMLPCNVIVEEHENGKVEVSAVNPVASMQSIENKDLAGIAEEVKSQLSRVIERI